ncbi:damage inducible protein CinA [Lasiosphaeria miniovina]|uniref:Damage inducible protein CinA n=1 Tax=Lasiosphaeria miniovina TaxID=1954250 RepID=A0AA40A0S0_9PEZI|nr:damage inducible protein CinA [Lasiosphaeria miniovina]KAK0707129.1 damage inducible protein CinA [Lasiosphaeria miniovina]
MDTEIHDLAQDVIRRLSAAGETVATGESLTGGMVSMALTSVDGASQVVRGSVTAYAPDIKVRVLKVGSDVIEKYTVYHGTVAKAMAQGAQNAMRYEVGTEPPRKTSWGIGTTGVAGRNADLGSPPGTVFIGIAHPDGKAYDFPYHFEGQGRNEVRRNTTLAALTRLREAVIARHKELEAGKPKEGKK